MAIPLAFMFSGMFMIGSIRENRNVHLRLLFCLFVQRFAVCKKNDKNLFNLQEPRYFIAAINTLLLIIFYEMNTTDFIVIFKPRCCISSNRSTIRHDASEMAWSNICD